MLLILYINEKVHDEISEKKRYKIKTLQCCEVYRTIAEAFCKIKNAYETVFLH